VFRAVFMEVLMVSEGFLRASSFLESFGAFPESFLRTSWKASWRSALRASQIPGNLGN